MDVKNIENILKHTFVTLHPTNDTLCLIYPDDDGKAIVTIPVTEDYIDTRYTLNEWLEDLENGERG